MKTEMNDPLQAALHACHMILSNRSKRKSAKVENIVAELNYVEELKLIVEAEHALARKTTES